MSDSTPEFWRHPDLPGFESRRSCQEISCYRAHSHDTFSIGIIDEGTSLFSGRLNGKATLVPGDTVLIPAQQVHSCNPVDGTWRYQMMHFDPAWASSLAPLGTESPIFGGVSVIRSAVVYEMACAANNSVFSGSSIDQIRNDLGELFSSIESAVPTEIVGGIAPESLAELAPALRRLQLDETHPPVAELAALVDKTPHAFLRVMRDTLGLTPLAWRQNTRILQARHMLQSGQSIADTAHRLGFTDQSHFHRVFRAHVAATPGVYRGRTPQ